MVHKVIMTSKYKVFFESLVLSLLILMIGISLGFLIESNRLSKVAEEYKLLEISALDLRLQNYYYQIMDSASCDLAIESNLKFADQLYSEGLVLEKYEQTEEFSKNLLLSKKKYVLLKTELWLNSIVLKKKCDNSFHTVVYVYSQSDDFKKATEQEIISKELKNLKDKYGNQAILIPIAGDIGLDSVDLQIRLYNVSYLPSTIIDEKYVLEGFHTVEELEKYLK
ncbi:hypothetical protein AUJ62_03980 [Candidatus Pacearchaeota archaeon CG1_02_32_21]|nr:MAG: hypothetical protein AUJ62_03980 [Candidatus Pacearchaeota archaeon CG1_02_32_21]